MQGSIVKRYPNSNAWTIIVELGRDPISGRRRQLWRSIKGTKHDAERRLHELLQQVDSGGFIKPSKLTLGEYLVTWLEDYARLNTRPRTYERYAEVITKHLVPNLGSIPLVSLQPHHVQSYYSKALVSGRRNGNGGLSALTVQKHHRILSEALRYGVRHDMLHRNVCDSVDPPRSQYKQMVTTSRDGVNRILEAVKGSIYYVPFYTAAFTGMRRSELLALRWKNVDVDFGDIAISETIHRLENGEYVVTEPKSRRGKRAVAMSPSLAILLREYKAEQAAMRERLGTQLRDDDLVFCHPDGSPIRPNSLTREFSQVAEAVGLKGLHLHSLRHCHATAMLQDGVHPKIVSERLGHSSVSITLDTYSHVLPGMQEEAALKFEQGFHPAATASTRAR